MKSIPILLLITGCAQAQPQSGILEPGTHQLTVNNQGFDWIYHIHIPKNLKEPVPLVIVLHGAGGEGIRQLESNGWRAMADREGFAVLAPTGLPSRPRLPANFLTNPRVWNSGQLNDNSPRTRINDTEAISKMLHEVLKRVKIDESRIYVCGHSNGAGMTFKLATDIPERFAAIAAVAGQLAIKNPQPKRALPTLYIIGTKDPLLPVEGGESTSPWGKRSTAPFNEWVVAWAKAIGAPIQPKQIEANKALRIEEYGPGKEGSFLRVVYIEGHGHGWPGGDEAAVSENLIGPKLKTYNATEEIWKFFRTFKKK